MGMPYDDAVLARHQLHKRGHEVIPDGDSSAQMSSQFAVK